MHHQVHPHPHPPPEPSPLATGFNLFTWGAALTAYPALCMRSLRGWQCEPVWVKVVGMCLVFPWLWLLGGGGSFALFKVVWWGMFLLAVLFHVRARRAAADGRLSHSRFIGLPFVAFLRPGKLTADAAHLGEAGMWVGFAVLAGVFDQPGFVTVCLAWAVTVLVEYALVSKREETAVRDTLDSYSAQQAHAARVRERLGDD